MIEAHVCKTEVYMGGGYCLVDALDPAPLGSTVWFKKIHRCKVIGVHRNGYDLETKTGVQFSSVHGSELVRDSLPFEDERYKY